MDKVIVKCDKCGSDISITPKVMRRHRNSNTGFKCKKCLSIEAKDRYHNLSEEEKKRRAEISKSKMKEYWSNMDSSDKEKRLDTLNSGFKEYINSRSDDEKKRVSKLLSESQSIRWKNMDMNKRQEILDILHTSSQDWYNSLSDDEKKEFHKHIQDGNRKWWDSLSDTEKEKYGTIRKSASKDYWNLVKQDPTVMNEISKRQSESITKYWREMTEDEYMLWDTKRQQGLTAYVNQLESDSMNSNEIKFVEYLIKNRIQYKFHYYNKIEHSDFDKLFPINPVTGSLFVSPYHQWDFIIHTLESDVLVDIDGSIHNKEKINYTVKYYNGKDINLSDMIEFNDSKRLYQTDGLPAYIIQCYDDNLTDETPVINISTGKIITLLSFISLILWMNMSISDKEEIIKFAFNKE